MYGSRYDIESHMQQIAFRRNSRKSAKINPSPATRKHILFSILYRTIW